MRGPRGRQNGFRLCGWRKERPKEKSPGGAPGLGVVNQLVEVTGGSPDQ